ncbi:cupin domain-containing protein [Celerinatantimonas sp. MCCC 1A17872]|uniref:cupin domain-containing protein n=1 Tax=Celerinatantimonas sp. MCCC 1A17872 TaxID=3177514 RepID=UPI0038C74B8C
MSQSEQTYVPEQLSTLFNGVGIFAKGEENTAYADYFTGKSFLALLNTQGVVVANVTFEPGCRNFWHIHHKGGQILLATGGRGWYQQSGEAARELTPGDIVYIAPETQHWHGAAKDSWFSHVAIEIPAADASNEWVRVVSDEEYNQLK